MNTSHFFFQFLLLCSFFLAGFVQGQGTAENPSSDDSGDEPCKECEDEADDTSVSSFHLSVYCGSSNISNNTNFVQIINQAGSRPTWAGRSPMGFDQRYRTIFNGQSRTSVNLRMESATFGPSLLLRSSLNVTRGTGAHIRYDASGDIRQILSLDTFVDVTDHPGGVGNGYIIKRWSLAAIPPMVLPQGAAYFPLPSQDPNTIFTVSKPTGADADAKLKIAKEVAEGVAPNVTYRTTFRYFRETLNSGKPASANIRTYDRNDSANGNLLRLEVLTYSNHGTKVWDYTIDRKIYEAHNKAGVITPVSLTPLALDNTQVSHTKEVIEDFSVLNAAGGEMGMSRLVERTLAPDSSSPLTTTWKYRDTPSLPRFHAMVEEIDSPDGGWVRYTYSGGPTYTQVTKYSSWENRTPAQKADARKEVSTYTASSMVKETYFEGHKILTETTNSSQNGGLLIHATTRELSNGESLSSTEAYHSSIFSSGDALGRFKAGRSAYSLHPDGTVTVHTFSLSGADLVMTTDTGGGTSTSVTDGTRMIKTHNSFEIQSSERTEDISSSLTISRWSGSVIDTRGRYTQIEHNGNAADKSTRTHSCCGSALEIDRDGTQRAYSRDDLGRVTKIVTSFPSQTPATPSITRLTDYEGRKITNFLSTSTTPAFLTSSTTRFFNGRIASSRTADPDGNGIPQTIYSYSGPTATTGLVVTTTLPNTATVDTEYLLDGQILRRVGSGVKSVAYSRSYVIPEVGGPYCLRTSTAKLPSTVGTVSFETSQTHTDPFGRVRKSRASHETESTIYSYYTAGSGLIGKLQQIDAPGGISTNFGYNNEGDRISTRRELPGGNADVTTKSITTVVNDAVLGLNCYKTVNSIHSGSDPLIETSTSYQSVRGVGSRSHQFNLASAISLYDRGANPALGITKSTTTSPDGAISVSYAQNGRTLASGQWAAGGSPPASAITVADLTGSTGFITGHSITYDDLGRTASVTHARTGTTSYNDYHPAGTLISITQPGVGTTSFTYDNMGRQLTVDAPNTDHTNITHTSYTLDGEIRATWGDQTYPKFYQYDEQGRMTHLHTWKTSPTLTQTTTSPPAGSEATVWAYQATTGLLIEKNHPGESGNGPGGSADYTYDSSGRILTRTWERGVVTTYTYDKGYLSTVDYSGETNGHTTEDQSYHYEKFGRLKTVKHGAVTHASYNWDTTTDLRLLNERVFRVKSSAQNTFLPNRLLTRKYDPFLRPAGFEFGTSSDADSIHEVTYGYDTAGRLGTVEYLRSPEGGLTPSAKVFTYGYKALSGNLIETVESPGGTTGPAHTVTNTWDSLRNVLSVKSNTTNAGPTPVSSYTYSVNTLGQRDNVTTSGSAFAAGDVGATAWEYNARGEVIEANHPNVLGDRSYAYDTIGNRRIASDDLTPPVTTNYTSNALNQYSATPESTTPILFDDDGNMEDNGGDWNYIWDGENRLVEVKTKVGASSFRHYKFRYDYLGRRVFQQRYNSSGGASGTSYFIYNGWNLIHQVSSSYTYGTDYLWGLDLSGTLQGAGGVGGLLMRNQTFDFSSSTSTYKTYFPTYDGNGNVSEYLHFVEDSDLGTAGNQATATLAIHWEYDPFGRIIKTSGPESSSNPLNIGQLDNVHRFSTKPFHKATGLYYYGYRYYDPNTGRWPSRDPIGERGGINLYGMVGNDAVNYWDFLGLLMPSEWKDAAESAKESGLDEFEVSRTVVSRGDKKNSRIVTRNYFKYKQRRDPECCEIQTWKGKFLQFEHFWVEKVEYINADDFLDWRDKQFGLLNDLHDLENGPELLGIASLIPWSFSIVTGVASLVLANQEDNVRKELKENGRKKPKPRIAYENEREVTAQELLEEGVLVRKRVIEGRCPKFVEVKPEEK